MNDITGAYMKIIKQVAKNINLLFVPQGFKMAKNCYRLNAEKHTKFNIFHNNIYQRRYNPSTLSLLLS